MNTFNRPARRGGSRSHGFLRACAAGIGALALFAMTAQGGINGGGRTRGVITAFGSVFVNGIEYDLTGSTITVNGVASTEDKLRVGQIVTIGGVVNDDLVTGQAATLEYESEVRGAVTSVDPATATFRVLGQRVRVDSLTKFSTAFVPANLQGIETGDIVEVSGYRTSAGQLVAGRVQVSASTQDRVVGKVSSLDEPTLTFFVNSLRVDYSNASVIDGELANGVVVEVQGPRATGGTLFARKVQVESEGLEGQAGEGASLEGLVTAPLLDDRFSINGQVVVVTSSTRFIDGTRRDIVADVRVEAEGRFDSSGRIVAEKVKIEHPDKAYVYANVESIDLTGRTLNLTGLKVNTTVGTRFDDNSDIDLPTLRLEDLQVGDTLEIRGYETRTAKRITAQRLVRQKDDNLTRIGGRVSSVKTNQFTVLDLLVVTNAGTQYRDRLDNAITPTAFYSTAANRDVKVKGDWNGTQFVAEEVEFQD